MTLSCILERLFFQHINPSDLCVTAVHLAAQNGHGPVLEVMRTSNSLRISSKKLGLTPLHVAAY